jgi:hypothetical protein
MHLVITFQRKVEKSIDVRLAYIVSLNYKHSVY